MIALVKRDWGIRGRKWGLEVLSLEDSSEEISFRTGSEKEMWAGILPRGPFCLVYRCAFIEWQFIM